MSDEAETKTKTAEIFLELGSAELVQGELDKLIWEPLSVMLVDGVVRGYGADKNPAVLRISVPAENGQIDPNIIHQIADRFHPLRISRDFQQLYPSA
ncbi:MAG: hypothetical protein U1C57_00095 [Candidatus Doudnabacteria bacterium]|nr:hypothetical protein [bacterium]MDZ4243491.1 hypothetical protein [Candidatus Doudnabacteria bacterium]